jgi:CheY-like chemotaxis protein
MRTGTKILIVDDSPDFHLLVKAFLSEEHYLLLSAADTLQATGSALREKPALIIVDIGLPGGDGWMLLDRLKSNAFTRNIPVVVVTGQTKQGLEEKSRTKGAVAFLTKPIEKQALLSTVTGILRPPTPPVPPATPA